VGRPIPAPRPQRQPQPTPQVERPSSRPRSTPHPAPADGQSPTNAPTAPGRNRHRPAPPWSSPTTTTCRAAGHGHSTRNVVGRRAGTGNGQSRLRQRARRPRSRLQHTHEPGPTRRARAHPNPPSREANADRAPRQPQRPHGAQSRRANSCAQTNLDSGQSQTPSVARQALLSPDLATGAMGGHGSRRLLLRRRNTSHVGALEVAPSRADGSAAARPHPRAGGDQRGPLDDAGRAEAGAACSRWVAMNQTAPARVSVLAR
jgi:hypothetical protein